LVQGMAVRGVVQRCRGVWLLTSAEGGGQLQRRLEEQAEAYAERERDLDRRAQAEIADLHHGVRDALSKTVERIQAAPALFCARACSRGGRAARAREAAGRQGGACWVAPRQGSRHERPAPHVTRM